MVDSNMKTPKGPVSDLPNHIQVIIPSRPAKKRLPVGSVWLYIRCETNERFIRIARF